MNKTPIKSNSAPDSGKTQAKPGQGAGMHASGSTAQPKTVQGEKNKGGVIAPAPHKNAGTTP